MFSKTNTLILVRIKHDRFYINIQRRKGSAEMVRKKPYRGMISPGAQRFSYKLYSITYIYILPRKCKWA
jgi:hypothetical protein